MARHVEGMNGTSKRAMTATLSIFHDSTRRPADTWVPLGVRAYKFCLILSILLRGKTDVIFDLIAIFDTFVPPLLTPMSCILFSYHTIDHKRSAIPNPVKKGYTVRQWRKWPCWLQLCCVWAELHPPLFLDRILAWHRYAQGSCRHATTFITNPTFKSWRENL